MSQTLLIFHFLATIFMITFVKENIKEFIKEKDAVSRTVYFVRIVGALSVLAFYLFLSFIFYVYRKE